MLQFNSENQEILHAKKFSDYAPVIYVAVIASGIASLMEFLTIKRVLTTQRLIIRHGIFRRTQEIAISELDEVSLRQSPLGKMFGYRTIIVAGMGRVNITMRYVRTPLEFMKELNKLQSV